MILFQQSRMMRKHFMNERIHKTMNKKMKIQKKKQDCVWTKMKNSSKQTHLLLCYVNRFVQYDPNGTFPATGMRSRSFICHIRIGVGNQRPQWNMSNRCGRACGKNKQLKYWLSINCNSNSAEYWLFSR